MIIYNFDKVRKTIIIPDKTDPVPIVDPDVVLPRSVPSELLKVVAAVCAQVEQCFRGLKIKQSSISHPLDILREFCGKFSPEDFLSFFVLKRADHAKHNFSKPMLLCQA